MKAGTPEERYIRTRAIAVNGAVAAELLGTSVWKPLRLVYASNAAALRSRLIKPVKIANAIRIVNCNGAWSEASATRCDPELPMFRTPFRPVQPRSVTVFLYWTERKQKSETVDRMQDEDKEGTLGTRVQEFAGNCERGRERERDRAIMKFISVARADVVFVVVAVVIIIVIRI